MIGVAPAVTVTSAWKPPRHEPTTRCAAVHAPGGRVVVVVVGVLPPSSMLPGIERRASYQVVAILA
ncbi:hypothetical protein K7G98_08865 [Saccharothrix sp. MB29]|nr:hypothetical protein [Saccharothrix sp. MB29]